MPYREDGALRYARGDVQLQPIAQSRGQDLLTRYDDASPPPPAWKQVATPGRRGPLPTCRAAAGYNVEMAVLELPSSPVARSNVHPHAHAVVLQPTRSLQLAGDADMAHQRAEFGPEGTVCGVGISLADRPPLAGRGGAERVVILDIKPRSPAAFCGRLAVGDDILAVGEQSTAGMSAAAVSQLVRGAEGSILRLSLRKYTDGTFAEVFLMRCIMASSSAAGAMNTAGSDGARDGSIGVTIGKGQQPGTWQAKVVKPGGGAWLGSPDWSHEGRCLQRTRLETGDSILSVDNKPVRKFEKPQAALLGAPFSRVSLQIERRGLSCCVDVIRTPLLLGDDFETCALYRFALGEKLQRLVSRDAIFRQHIHEESDCESAWHAAARWQDEPADQNLNKSRTTVSAAREEGRGDGTIGDYPDGHVLESRGEGASWRVALSPCSNVRADERHQRASSPTGSVDSLDDVIQQLDKAASLDDEIQKLGSAIAPALSHCVPFKKASDFREGDLEGVDKFTNPSIGSGFFHPHTEKEETGALNAKELANADRSDRSLNVLRDLTWISPKRTPRRRSRSRSSSRSPSSGRKNHVCRSHDGRYELNDGPIHLRVPNNWSAWVYAGNEAYLFAVHFQSGIENTKASAEMLSAARVADADEEEKDEEEKALFNASAMALISEEFLAEQAFLKEVSRESTMTRYDVTVKRGPDGKLGMKICVTELSDLVLISALIQDGAAAKSGLLQAGDVLHAVDGEGFRGLVADNSVTSHLSGAPNSEVVLTISRAETLTQPLQSMHAGVARSLRSLHHPPDLEFLPSTPAETQGWQESLTAGIVLNRVSHLSPSTSPTTTQPLATVALVAENAVFTKESRLVAPPETSQDIGQEANGMIRPLCSGHASMSSLYDTDALISASSLGRQTPMSAPFESPRLSRSESPKSQPYDSSPGGGKKGGVGGLIQSKSSEGAKPKESSNISSLQKAKPDFMDGEDCDSAQAKGSSTSASAAASIPGVQHPDVSWGRYFALEGSPQVHHLCLEEPPQVNHLCLEEREEAAQKKEAEEEEAARKKEAEVEEAARQKKAAEEEAARRKKAEDYETAQKKAEEAVAARKKAEEEKAARTKAEEAATAAAKKAAEEEAARKKTEVVVAAALAEKAAAEKRAKEMEEELACVKRAVEEESRLRRAREEEHARLEAEARHAAEEEKARMEAECNAKEEEKRTEQERREQERLEMLARGAHKQANAESGVAKRESPQSNGEIRLSKGADDGHFRHLSRADVPGTDAAKQASPALGENLADARHAPGSERVSYEASPVSSEFPPECEAGMLKLFKRGCTNQQVMRHFTMVDYNLTLAQVQRFREKTGISGTGQWVKDIGRVGSSTALNSHDLSLTLRYTTKVPERRLI